MSFTFGILAYNQEKEILETLESIRYQIQNYAKYENINLIFIDDSSADKTVDVASKWINYRKKLFHNIELLVNKKNRGTVYNYNLLMKKIDEPFKIIAGDDVIASGNIIGKIKNLSGNILNTYVCTDLSGGNVKYNEFRGLLFFYDKRNLYKKNYAIKAVRRGWFFHTPSTHYSKKLFETAKCTTINKNFKLFEDDPSWYAMVRNINNLNINFIDDIVVLYRISEKSVSNAPVYSPVFSKELNKLRKYYYNEAKGWEHIVFWFRIHENIPKILRLDKYINKLRELYLYHIIKNTKDYREFKKHMEFMVEKEQKYYNKICRNVIQYEKEVL